MFGPQYRLIPSRRAQPAWPKCRHNEYAVVQVLEGPNDGGRRFFRCPRSGVQITNSTFFYCLWTLHVYCHFSQMAKCDFSRWIDPPHERYVDRYVDTLWARIWDLEYRMESLTEEINDLREQMQRERGNEEVVNIGSSYDPTCCCANPSCICACHYHDGQPRPRRPPQQFSMWVPRGSFGM